MSPDLSNFYVVGDISIFINVMLYKNTFDEKKQKA
jgi:hypothetical protein